MDFLIDPYRFAPALPMCGEVVTMVKQTQSYGGSIVGDGMPQSGPAVTSKADFIASLQSYVLADLNHVAASTGIDYDSTTKLTMFGGAGQLYAETTTNLY